MTEWIFERPDGFESDAKHDAFCKGELVRCKDCKHSDFWTDTDGTQAYACEVTFDNFGYQADVKPDHYCSYGERKDYE